MADTKFTQPMLGRRTFIGGALATGALATLAGCGGGGDEPAGRRSSAAPPGDNVMSFYLS